MIVVLPAVSEAIGHPRHDCAHVRMIVRHQRQHVVAQRLGQEQVRYAGEILPVAKCCRERDSEPAAGVALQSLEQGILEVQQLRRNADGGAQGFVITSVNLDAEARRHHLDVAANGAATEPAAVGIAVGASNQIVQLGVGTHAGGEHLGRQARVGEGFHGDAFLLPAGGVVGHAAPPMSNRSPELLSADARFLHACRQ